MGFEGTRGRLAAVALTTLVLPAGCGALDPGAAQTPETTTGTATQPAQPAVPSGVNRPPPVTVRFFGESVALRPWTYCYGNACVDGMPPARPAEVGDPEQVVVEFPLERWSFGASFRLATRECGRVQDVSLAAVGRGRFVLRPAGHAGTYDVTLVGRGAGDLFATFRWTTPVDGALPTPRARLAVLAGHDGTLDSYGVELELTNLARTPKRASARITVRAADGAALTFAAKRSPARCLPEGTVYWDGPDEKGLAAAALGEGPFTYRVVLELDGARYAATATWPADVIAGNEPSVALRFRPSLPGLS